MKYKKAPDPHKPLTDAEFDSMDWKYGLDGIAELVGEEFVAPLRKRGRPKIAEPKAHVNLRLDARLIKHLRSTGRGWQTRLNDFLNKSVEQGLV